MKDKTEAIVFDSNRVLQSTNVPVLLRLLAIGIETGQFEISNYVVRETKLVGLPRSLNIDLDVRETGE